MLHDGELPVTETAYADADLPGTSSDVDAGCGNGTALVSTVESYDRGLGRPTFVRDPAEQPTQIVYDGFGRVSAIYKVDPSSPGSVSSVPSTTVQYSLPTPGSGRSYSTVHTSTQDGADASVASYLESWAYVDGLGRTFVVLKEAEDGKWIVSGLTNHDAKGAIRRKFLETFYAGSGDAYPFQGSPGAPIAAETHDAFGRVATVSDYGGVVTTANAYHALSTDTYDAEDLNVGGPHHGGNHSGTYFTELRDGHGRVVKTTERFMSNGDLEERYTKTQFLPTGAPELIRRTRKTGKQNEEVSRYLVYDTLGRLVLNVDPNTSPTYAIATTPNANASTNDTTYDSVVGLRYRYNDAGDLVGTSDSRGCGVNFFHDGLGRLLFEDYFPCDGTTQATYSAPTFSSGVPTSGVEVAYEYDSPSSTPAAPTGWSSGASAGKLVRTRDRASHTLVSYDARGNAVATAVQLAKPDTFADDAMASRYAPRWYRQDTAFDAADRPTTQSTGAQVAALLGSGSASTVTSAYGPRGTLASVTSSYDYGTSGGGAELIHAISRDPDGQVAAVDYGDARATGSTFDFDVRRQLTRAITFRGAAESWPESGLDTFQQSLEDTGYEYDLVGNPWKITDYRNDYEWPDGAKPVSREMEYDDLYRVSSVTYTYAGVGEENEDQWTSPLQDELTMMSNPSDPASQIDLRRALPSPQVTFSNRPQIQTYDYDWLGNGAASDDDVHGFYDRSLGTITNGTAAAGPYRLTRAEGSGSHGGTLRATYDAGGNMTALYVSRSGSCSPSGAGCSAIYLYEWDEIARLTRARRWDYSTLDVDSPPTPSGAAAADLRYHYDADDNRVLKTATDSAANARHTAYVFDSLELRRAAYPVSGDYDLTENTEVPYLFANGVRIARVAYEPDAPVSSAAAQHVFLELVDHLGSTSTVIDKATGELVEKATYQPYGAPESDYRPGRWHEFREDYRFTGKEEDVEIGLTYFGKRFYSAQLGRWMSPDPLAVHEAGDADLNLYAYVGGQALKDVDPLGLESIPGGAAPTEAASKGTGAPQEYDRVPKTAAEKAFEAGYNAESENLKLRNQLEHTSPRLYEAKLSEGMLPDQARKYVDHYVEKTLSEHLQPIPEGSDAQRGAEQARKDAGPTFQDVAEAVNEAASLARTAVAIRKGAPVPGTGKKAGRAYPAEVRPGEPGKPRVTSTQPLKKSDATKEATRGGKFGGVVGSKTQARKMGGPEDPPHQGGLPHTHPDGRKPAGHFWYDDE